MKQYRFLLFFMAAIAVVLSPSVLAVTLVGEDTTTQSNWRTAAALEGDFEYGTDGYVIYGLNSPDGTWNSPYDASSLTAAAADSAVLQPSYIADITLAGATGRWSGDGNFGQIEDPAAGNALTSTPVLAWGDIPYVFTITRSSAEAFLLTVLLTDGDGVDETWNVDVQAGSESAALTTTANGGSNTTYVVFVIPSGGDDVVVTISSNVNTWGAITGFAFDSDFVTPPHDPEPANDPLGTGDKVDVDDVTLTWNTAMDANDLLIPTIKKHSLFGTFANPSDPNLYFVADVDAGDPVQATASYNVGALQRDQVYRWQIIEILDDGQGGTYPLEDPNNIVGPVWTFYTALSVPDIDSLTPANQVVGEGENAMFTVAAINPFTGDSTGLEYQWYENDVLMSGETAATLTVNTVTEAMNGNAYYCKVTITSNGAEADSGTAALTVKMLIAHWPLDGDPNDISGNGYDGTEQNGIAYAEGICGSLAADCDGADDFINFGNVPVMRDGGMSICFWAKPRDITGDWKGIVSKWETASEEIPHTFWIGQHSTDGMLNYSTYLPGETRNTPAGVLTNNEWSHFVCTFDGQFQKTFANGLLVAEVAVTDTLDDLAGDFMIGQVPAGANFFNGLVDDVRVYNYALDVYEAADLYVACNGPFCVEEPEYDVTGDCKVNLLDFAEFAAAWLDCGTYPTCITEVE